MYDFVPLPQKNSLACCTSSNPMLSHNSAALLVSEGRSCFRDGWDPYPTLSRAISPVTVLSAEDLSALPSESEANPGWISARSYRIELTVSSSSSVQYTSPLFKLPFGNPSVTRVL